MIFREWTIEKFKTMQDQSTFPHKKVCLALFVISCIFLTIFYYDKAILDYPVEFPTQDIIFLVNATYEKDSLEDNGVSPKPNNSGIFKNTNKTSKGRITISTSSVLKKRTESESNSLFRRKLQSEDLKFLVSSSKCKILDLDPFNKDAKRYYHPEKYKPCRKLDLLTYSSKVDNTTFIHIDNEIVPSYDKEGVTCCYSTVKRQNHTDNHISISNCVIFQNNISIQSDPVMVKCKNSRQKQVYENVHVAVTVSEEIQKKLNTFDHNTKPLSVLFIGIDSISRLNFVRSLPNTFQYVEENGWIPLKGYNKMDDNTFPNVMAILTGFNQTYAYNVCNPKVEGKLDKCPILWYDFRKFGYVTAYAEDEGSINTFNYLKKGFQVPPTDYYFRTYVLATEKMKKVSKDGLTYCTGPETAGERIMNLAKDFALTFKDYPSFGFFWMNSFSHNNLNAAAGMDSKLKKILEEIAAGGVENTVIILLSDHGMRFGDFRLTDTGWQEERLPFIYVLFPKWFKEKYPREYNNFQSNTNKLTCPYDLHMTLKHILVLAGKNVTMTHGDACPKCKSLFEKIEVERSCEDAAIAQHWCTCTGYTTAIMNKDLQNNFTNYVINEINNIIQNHKGDTLCAKYSLHQLINTRMSQKLAYKNETYLLMKFKTHPKAVFETTLKFEGDISSKFSLSGDISRLDSYSDHSKCVSDAYLKKYCYCRS